MEHFSSVRRSLTFLVVPWLLGAPISAADLVSSKSDGTQGDSWSMDPSVSATGRFVAFTSNATNLVPGDTNTHRDVFVKDRVTGLIERVSVDSSGNQGTGTSNGDSGSYAPSISADGRYVAFVSASTNLVAGDSNNRTDVFVKDRQTGALVLASASAAGAQGNAASVEPDLSADGHYVAFGSQSTNLTAEATSSHNLYLKNLVTGEVERLSVDSNEASFNGSAYEARVSSDGQRAVFTLENFSDGTFHVLLRDRSAGTTSVISVHTDGTPGNHQSFGASITPDGRHVAFWSDATNLVDTDTNSARDVFVRDLDTATTVLASVDSSEAQGTGWSYHPAISGDGRFVVFISEATNLVGNDLNGKADVFLRDLVAGETIRISMPDAMTESNGHSNSPTLTSSGNLAFFSTVATNFLSPDTNGAFDDVFARGNPFFVPVYQPDNILTLSDIAAGIGLGIHAGEASAQTLKATSRRASPVRAKLFVSNDGNVDDVFDVSGGDGNRFFQVAYSDGGGNQTADVIAGTYNSPSTGPGESNSLEILVKPVRKTLLQKVRKKGRVIRKWKSASLVFPFSSTSQGDGSKLDTAALAVGHRR